MTAALRLKLLCIALAMASCAAPDAPPASPEGRWEIVAASFADIDAMPGNQRATMLIRDGRISAFSGCNTGAAAVSNENGRLIVAAMASTRRACLNQSGDFEIRYFGLLQARPSFRVESSMLTLTAGADSMRFRPMPDKVQP